MAFKRVATEGATTDGREISREWIEQMAANYDPAVFGARISMEHMRGIFPDGPFRAYGDVRALKAAEDADGKLQLYADIDPTDDLKQMVKNRQKVYTSIEVEPNFAKTGEAYLTGLAVTDNPASLGTEMLAFSAQQERSPLASRKRTQTALFSSAAELAGALDADDHDFGDTKPTLSERIAALFKRNERYAERTAAAGDECLRDEIEAGMQLFADKHQALAARLDDLPSAEDFSALKTKVDEIYSALDNTPDQPPRQPATGAATEQLTDC